MARPRTLRARLSLGIAVLVLAVLAVVGVVVYYGTARRLTESLNASLRTATAQAMAGTNNQNGHLTLGPQLDEGVGVGEATAPGVSLTVFGPTGRVLRQFGPNGRSITQAVVLAAAQRGATTSSSVVDLTSGARVRVRTTPLREEGRTLAVFGVAMSEEPTLATLRQLRLTLLVLLPLAAAVAALLGYVLTRRMLRPLARMQATAAEISSRDLSRRLGLAGDDEVGRLAATFDAMLDRLEDSFVRERRFVSDASHELRTPVAAVGAIVAVTRGRRRSAVEYERALDDVAAENERLNTLVERLLELARGDAGRVDAPQRLDVSELLRDVVASLDVVAKARGLDLVGEIDDGLAVNGDGDRLVQLFVNLIDNAIKYTQRGEVRVQASQSDATVRVEVRDSGSGISGDDLPRVFERFFRGDPSRSADGAGLGLPIAAEVARAHGGTIDIDSAEGHGTVCSVTLPAAAH
jgi:heavy metal sensor kinase